MSISSSFLWRFLEDVWDLLPTEDRELFQTYWSAQLQIAANLEQKVIEAGLSTEVATVPVFLTERWEQFVMDEDSCDLFTKTDALTLTGVAEVPLSKETAFYDTAKITNSSGQIYHEETIQFFDDAVHSLRYGNIVKGTLSVSLTGFHADGTGGTITATDTLVKVGAFANVTVGMILKVTAATPSTPVGIYTVRAVPDDDTVIINEDFGVGAATGVAFEVDEKLLEYSANRDYAANLSNGTIQAIDTGRIPPTELLIVRYQHIEYTRGIDYELDEVRGTIRRISGTTIGDGETVSALYTYNGTATLPMEGSSASVTFASLVDEEQDFSTLLDGRTLTITSGPNAGSYLINSVISPHEIQIAGNFPVEQSTDVVYRINAYPHGIKVDKAIGSIPYLQDLVDNPTLLLVEDVDYTVRDGILSVRNAFRLSSIGPEDLQKRQSWAEIVKINKETPYRNFGVLIDFFRENSEEYKLALQGLWYTFWTGSTPGNLGRGLHILLGLPFAKKEGTVSRVDEDAEEIDVTDSRGQIITYTIPSGLDPSVAVGDTVDRFDSLTTGVDIIDRNNEPGFVANRLGRAGIERFLTSKATRGIGNTDETKALTLLENHLFLPQVLTAALTQRVNVDELVTFLDNMKPQWTEYVFSFSSEETEGIVVSEEFEPLDLSFDLTTTVGNNQINQAAQIGDFRVQSAAALPATLLVPVFRTTGRILSGGTQATGNFRDSGIDFADLGIDRFDIVQIEEGPFKGDHTVLKRVSSNTLSLDIPDASIVGVTDLSYLVIPSERRLGNDAISLRGEHVLKAGTDYPAPTTLNTKTDFDFSTTSFTDEDVKALLLVDIGIGGSEVQAITAADVDLNEFDVATSPGVVTRDHEIASAALVRTDNLGPTVTDAFAI